MRSRGQRAFLEPHDARKLSHRRRNADWAAQGVVSTAPDPSAQAAPDEEAVELVVCAAGETLHSNAERRAVVQAEM
jgi:hypothetical protein